MTSEEWDAISSLSALANGNDSECASAARFPIDGDEFRIGLVTGVSLRLE
jgi:hypothetical protein